MPLQLSFPKSSLGINQASKTVGQTFWLRHMKCWFAFREPAMFINDRPEEGGRFVSVAMGNEISSIAQNGFSEPREDNDPVAYLPPFNRDVWSVQEFQQVSGVLLRKHYGLDLNDTFLCEESVVQDCIRQGWQPYPPKESVSNIVRSLKGVSARMLRQELPDLARHYWQDQFWSPSYFAASCGGAPLSIIKEYIDQQQRPS